MPPKRLSNLSVGSLKTPAKKAVTGLALPKVTPEAQQVTTTQQIPEIQLLIQQVPAVQPFLTKELIPDLLYLYQTGGIGAVQEAVSKADPAHPETLIFNHPSQDAHRATFKVEMDLIQNIPNVVESDDIQCTCGSRRVQISPPIQTRSADEPATYFARCVMCTKQWRFSAA